MHASHVDPATRGALNNSLRLCVKNGDDQLIPGLLQEGADGIAEDKSSIFKVAACHKQAACMKMLAEQLPIQAAFNIEAVSHKNNWILDLIKKPDMIPYLLIFIKHTHWLYTTLSPHSNNIIVKGIFTQLLIKSVELNYFEITKLLLEKNLLVHQNEKIGNELITIAVEKTKDPQMIALLKKFNLGKERARSVIEPNPTSPVEMALALNEIHHPVFFIIEHYFVKKLTINPQYNSDIRAKLQIFSTLVRITIQEREPLLIESKIKAYLDTNPFPITSTDFRKTVAPVLAYRGDELQVAGFHYRNRLNGQPDLQASILAHIQYGDNLLFQMHFILFAEKENLPAIKYERWVTDVSNIIIELESGAAMNGEQFANIITQATHDTVDLMFSIFSFQRERFGEIHEIQTALLPLSKPENTEKRIELFKQYETFLENNTLGGDFNARMREALLNHKTRTAEKQTKKRQP